MIYYSTVILWWLLVESTLTNPTLRGRVGLLTAVYESVECCQRGHTKVHKNIGCHMPPILNKLQGVKSLVSELSRAALMNIEHAESVHLTAITGVSQQLYGYVGTVPPLSLSITGLLACLRPLSPSLHLLPLLAKVSDRHKVVWL